MKKLLVPLMISLCLLCGCADKGEESFEQFTTQLREKENISFTADVRAEYADKTAEFCLKYTQTGDSACITVVEPEIIAGISARVREGSLQLEYDGAILDIGQLADSDLSPMSALPLITDALKNAYIDLAWTEDDMIAARLMPDDDTVVTVWLSGELVPQSAQISYKEKTVVFAEISQWEAS